MFRKVRRRRTTDAPGRGFTVAPGEAGLTLTEMIVVLAIIGLVAALIVPNVIGRPDEARSTVANADIRTISAALKMYRLDNSGYPTTEQGLEALVRKPTRAPIPRNWSEDGYLTEVPLDPWGRPYIYRSPGEHGGFDLFSLGRDGKLGGEGPDSDLKGTRS
jgi:general secretion pathway protein G